MNTVKSLLGSSNNVEGLNTEKYLVTKKRKSPTEDHSQPNCSNIRLIDSPIVSTDGNRYVTSENERLLDFLSAACTTPFGNSPIYQRVTNAYCAQAMRVPNITPYFANDKVSYFRSLLSDMMATIDSSAVSTSQLNDSNGHNYYMASLGLTGSDSIDAAVKMAIAYTGKNPAKVLSFHSSYHGQTGHAHGATAFTRKSPLDQHYHYFDFPKNEADGNRVLQQIESEFKRDPSCTAFVYEYIQGDGGMNIPPDGFFRGLQRLCKEYRVITIVDEIQSGLGRTGKLLAVQHEFEGSELFPDLIVLGKGLAGGACPLSAVLGKQPIVNSLNKPGHVFSFALNPATCAAGAATIEALMGENLPSIHDGRDLLIPLHNAEIGEKLQSELRRIADENPGIISDVRGRGLMLGIEFSDPKNAMLVHQRCVQKGVLFGLVGENNQVIRVTPSYTIEPADIKEAINTFDAAITELSSGKIPETTYQKAEKIRGIGSTANLH